MRGDLSPRGSRRDEVAEAMKSQTPENRPYEKPAVEKQLSKEDLEREFLYAGQATKPPSQPAP